MLIMLLQESVSIAYGFIALKIDPEQIICEVM